MIDDHLPNDREPSTQEALAELVADGLMETKTVIRNGLPVDLFRLTPAGQQRAGQLTRQLTGDHQLGIATGLLASDQLSRYAVAWAEAIAEAEAVGLMVDEAALLAHAATQSEPAPTVLRAGIRWALAGRWLMPGLTWRDGVARTGE